MVDPNTIDKFGTYPGIVLFIKYANITTHTPSKNKRIDGDKPFAAFLDWLVIFL